jgi:hypothetical protein
MRHAIILAAAVLGTLANVVPGLASSAHALAPVNHNEIFLRDHR